jgi:peptidyl-tRNA hydrolase, PTH1 family
MSGSQPIQVIAGLGNPGKAYADTRHNIGFMLVDDWAVHLGWRWKRSFRFRGEWTKGMWEGRDVHMIKPHTFMNASGASIRALLQFLKLDAVHLMCVYDDITLEPGRLKLSVGGGDGGHNGIKDIQRELGNGFTRFRVGVGSKPIGEMDLKDWVLSRFSQNERDLLGRNLDFYRNSAGNILRVGPALAMNTINQN